MSDQIPCIVIPAFKPGPALLEVARELLDGSGPGEAPDIVVVDDGSGPEFGPVFAAVADLPGVTVLRHAVNLGKGAALKTAFNHILLNTAAPGAVTADADGQHRPEDILAVAREFAAHEGALVLGCRGFDRAVPLRSLIGNKLTAAVTHFFLGKKILDTQTGLRAIPRAFLGDLLRLKTTGYDFEMDMLVTTVNKGYGILQVPIATVYIDQNKESHFNPFFDSLAIYYVFLRHLGNSITSAIIDYFVFSVVFSIWGSVGGALVSGRIISGTFNFLTAKHLVFKSQGGFFREVTLYVTLVCLLAFTAYILISQLYSLGVPVLLAKILVELSIFFIAFLIQRAFIFQNRDETEPPQ